MEFQIKQVSALNRIFLDGKCEFTPVKAAKVLKGERFSYQLAYKSDERFMSRITVESDLGDAVCVRAVGNVPSELPCYPDKTDYCERATAGLFPDVLFPVNGELFIKPFKWFSVWVTAEIPTDIQAGDYTVTVNFAADDVGELASETFTIKVLDAVLPEQTLINTEWFHTDCIADYYKVPVFSEEHWTLIRSFMEAFTKCGNNMILTPVFTPPLDTNIGGERTTVQLIDVRKDGDKYSFNFDKFRRWVNLALECGIKYFEISHLFSQWGAFAAPKVMAEVDGEIKRIFGWETEAAGEEYSAFLNAFIPELIAVIKELKIENITYFHVSDEPSEEQVDSYTKAKDVIADLLKDFPIIDALSDYEFFENGLIKQPIPATSSIDEFIEKGFDNRWTYYCCGQGEDLSNRFFSMPLSATKIIGAQLYLHDIKGFLQWGFNFYNSAKSLRHISPYEVTDADCAFPSGDSFIVYPYDNGAIMSVRGEVFFDALQEMRALQLLEALIGKKKTAGLLTKKFGEIRFRTYPRGTKKMIALDKLIKDTIEKNI
ncbi:MAG: DUF4091 domain-containing protein [Clostridia bacterium]|nr:DUF4091 domain-containing protein [Clostridia bacterium]